jgi:hypothetical protein
MKNPIPFRAQAVNDRGSTIRPPWTNIFLSRPILASRLIFLLLVFFALTAASAVAQQNPLNRSITLHLTHARLEDALDRIGQEGRFSFSYNPALLRLDSLVDIKARNTAVRKVAADLLGPRYELRWVGNHVVVRVTREPPQVETLPKHSPISGYLIDAQSGEKVVFATVYENAHRTSSLTDGQGHYTIIVPGDVRQVELAFSKKGFRDTVIVVNPRKVENLTVGLEPIPGFLHPLAAKTVTSVGLKSRETLPLERLFVPEEQRTMAGNVLEALRSFPIQISFLPALGTNKLLSGGMDNNVSINILAGYANGVKGMEVGGLVNLDRANVTGFQAAGLANIVGGNVHGVQVAGLVNHVKGQVKGIQVGGLVNYTPNAVKGIQVAGLTNVVPADVSHLQIGGIYNHGHRIGGFQIGGVANYAKADVGGFQIGGVSNYAKGNVGGFQIGGVSNYAAGNVRGFQIGGIANYTKGNVGGFQVGGIVNYAGGNVSKGQIAGIVNKAGTVNGCQIGLINIADSVGGVLIGLFNVVKKGYKVLEFSTNDVTQANIAYKTGRQQIYSILTAGWRFGPGHFALSYGAGFGAAAGLGPLNLALEVTCNDVVEQGLGPHRLNMLIPARLSLGIPLGRRLEFFGGAALNLHITNPQNGLGEFQSDLGPNPLWRYDGYRTRTQIFPGYQGGIRIHLWNQGKENPRAQRQDETSPKNPDLEQDSKPRKSEKKR